MQKSSQEKTESNHVMDYNEFLINNRSRVNKYLNKVLWFFVITGPAIAAGIKGGIFRNVHYGTCVNISVIVILLSTIHFVMMKKRPTQLITCLFVLAALDVSITYMSCSHIGIYLTWFLVPLLSLLFCDKFIYLFAVSLNYILMFFATWMTAAHEVAHSNEYKSATAYLAKMMGGFTIETLIMVASGYIIGKLTVEYFKNLFSQYKVIKEQERGMKEKMELLDSMAEIYDNVNLIDFVNHTEVSLRDAEQKKHGIDMHSQTQTQLNQKLNNRVMPDQMEQFLSFTNIKTVRARLSHKKLISADFIDVVSGWFRAQYITVDSTLDGIPNVVIYTTRNVDEEKRREEHLIRISMTDEMTRLFNRRCYDEDLRDYRNRGLAENFVLFSIDVNGLKTVNDTKGHAAGDELIKGAADCLALTVGNSGKVYRTGGDEFMAIVHTTDPEGLRERIGKKAKEWHGIYVEEVTLSVGYCAHKDQLNASIDELERMADADMYVEKEKYYRTKGIDRRKN